jgi:WD40 repeat protein
MGSLEVRDGGRSLLVGCGRTLLWYRIDGGKAIETRRMDFEGTITSISSNEGVGLVAIGFQGGEVALVDPLREGAAAVLWRVLASPDDGVRVALSPDGTRVASAGKGPLIRVLDASDGEQVLALGGHGDTILSIAYSPDGNTLASGSIDGTIRIWRAVPSASAFPDWD